MYYPQRPQNAFKRHVTLIGAGFGFCAPLFCYGIAYLLREPFSSWTLVVWPSSIMLLAIFRRGDWIIVIPISVAINIVLYAAIGYLLAEVLTRIRRTQSHR